MTVGPRVHAFVMAGGTGSRLHPLTLGQCKPALPFGGNYRVVDFVFGNLWNSRIDRVDVLVQYEPQSLAAHVRRTWNVRNGAGAAFVEIAPPEAGAGDYRGTADAVRQNLFRLDGGAAERPDLVAVFGADHVYRMDVRRMVEHHLREQADVTCATLPVPLAAAGAFGIVDTGDRGRVVAFREKPAAPTADPARPGHALASMGNYVFSADVLRRELRRAGELGETDFGLHVLPRLLRSHRVVAYDFHGHHVPGLRPHEDAGYWRDVGTLDAYFRAHMDTLGGAPRFALGNPAWPVTPRAVVVEPATLDASEAHRSTFGSGTSVERAWLDQTVAGRDVTIHRGARLQRALLFDGVHVGSGARLKDVIVDRDNAIPAGESIGHDRDADRARFHCTDGGVVVVPRGFFPGSAPAAGLSPRAASAAELHAH